MTLAELLAAHAAALKPTDGDPGVVTYWGIDWEGTLEYTDPARGRGNLRFDPRRYPGRRPHAEPVIQFGYEDGTAQFDPTTRRFRVVADAD